MTSRRRRCAGGLGAGGLGAAGAVLYTHQRLGLFPSWLLGALGLAVADAIASMLPNLL